MQPSGLLFYNGRLNEKHDFLALELVAGQARLTYSTGGCRGGVGGPVGAYVGEAGASASPESPQVCLAAHLNMHLHAKWTPVRAWFPWPFPAGKCISPRSPCFSCLSRGTRVQPVWSPVCAWGVILSMQGHPGSSCACTTWGEGNFAAPDNPPNASSQQASPTQWSAPQFQGA